MPKYSKLDWGCGSRRQQPVYKPGAEKGSKPLYMIWRGYDRIETDSGKIKVTASVGKKGTRKDLDKKLEKKREQLLAKLNGGTPSAVYLSELQDRLTARAGKLITADEFPSAPTLNQVIERYFDSSAVKRQSSHGSRYKNELYWENFVKLSVMEGLEPLGNKIMADITEDDIFAIDRATQNLNMDRKNPKPLDHPRRAQVRKYSQKTKETTIEWCEDAQPISAKYFYDFKAWLGQVWQFAMINDKREWEGESYVPRTWTGVNFNVPRAYVADRAKTERSGKRKHKLLTGAEIKRLLESAQELGDESLTALIAIELCAWDRPTACRTLEWSKFDDEHNWFTLDGQWIQHAGETSRKPLKNKENKFIVIPVEFRKFIMPTREYSDWVVPVSRKIPERHLSEGALQDRWKKLVEHSGIVCVPYDIKHSLITKARKQGFTMDQIKGAAKISTQMAEQHYLLEDSELRISMTQSVLGDIL